MGTRTVRLDEDLYERIKSEKRPDETFSEAIDRLLDGYSLVDFANDRADRGSTTAEERLAAIAESEAADRRDRDERNRDG